MIDEAIERFQQIDKLIQKQKTGNAAELAQTIGVSKRTVYRIIKLMKKLGAPIEYNVLMKSYFYKQEGNFVCAFTYGVNNDTLEKGELQKLKLSVCGITEYLAKLNASLGLNSNN